jgi:glycosyltransferase involved in cell wall biosynthesis
MIIGIDANEANTKVRVGINQYAFELLWSIYKAEIKSTSGNVYILYLKENPISELPGQTDRWKYRVLPGKYLWIFTKLTPHLIFNRRIDVFFTPGHYLPILTLKPLVCTIHDLGFLDFTEQFTRFDYWQLKLWTAISVFVSKDIIAVSESTKQDIVRHYRFASNKVKVIHHGVNFTKFNPEITSTDVRRIKNKYKIKGEYILSLGTLKPSKNLEGILRSFRITRDLGYRIKLVIAGKKGWMYKNIFEKAKKMDLNRSIIYTDYVDENDKPALIKGAKVFLSPSHWEGFGMHILEAMACGTPVVASNLASIPEICGNGCYLVNPDDVAEIVEGIKYFLNLSPAEYNKEKEKVIEQSKKFSWEISARKTINLIQK